MQKTNYDYNYVHNLVSNTNIVSNNLKSKYILITDGELSTIIYMLLNYTQNIMCININYMTVGLNMWLIKKINDWIQLAKSKINLSTIPFCIVGNKCDLENEREVSVDEGN